MGFNNGICYWLYSIYYFMAFYCKEYFRVRECRGAKDSLFYSDSGIPICGSTLSYLSVCEKAVENMKGKL